MSRAGLSSQKFSFSYSPSTQNPQTTRIDNTRDQDIILQVKNGRHCIVPATASSISWSIRLSGHGSLHSKVLPQKQLLPRSFPAAKTSTSAPSSDSSWAAFACVWAPLRVKIGINTPFWIDRATVQTAVPFLEGCGNFDVGGKMGTFKWHIIEEELIFLKMPFVVMKLARATK
jgi:hypothetical protein